MSTTTATSSDRPARRRGSDVHTECNDDLVDEPVLHVPDWPADDMLELERIRDEPTLSDLWYNQYLRSLWVALVAFVFLATQLVAAGIVMLVDLNAVGALLILAAVFVARSSYRLTREIVCHVGGRVCQYCKAENARWQASSAREGVR